MSSFCVNTVARGLLRARASRAAVGAQSLGLPTTIPNAYLVQNAMREMMAEGKHTVDDAKINTMGWKIGATNDKARQALGLQKPFYGSVFDFHKYTAFDVAMATYKFDEFITSRAVEPEIALRLGRDVSANSTTADICEAVSHVAATIEVVDSAVGGPREGSQVIADNAGHGRLIIGNPVEWKNGMFNPETIKVWLRVNGKVERESHGGFVDGGAFAATSWLARAVHEHGHSLKAGDWITTGSTSVPYPANKGDLVEVEFEGLGRTSVKLE